MSAHRKKREAVIRRVHALGPGLGRVDLAGEGIGQGVSAGQFAMVEAPDRPDCILLRPFSYFLVSSTDEIALLVKEVGAGTRALLAAAPDTPARVLGPLGTAFPQPKGPCWLVAGGVGAAPCGGLVGLPGVRVLYGARTASEAGLAAGLQELGANLKLATDDGSAGFSGTVTELMAAELSRSDPPAAIYTCGPAPMMAEVSRIAAEREIPCWVSLEERMGCGFGVCRGCAHRDASGGWRCICEDGPVYEASVIFGGQT